MATWSNNGKLIDNMLTPVDIQKASPAAWKWAKTGKIVYGLIDDGISGGGVIIIDEGVMS